MKKKKLEICREELEKIKGKNGKLTAEIVLTEAKNKKHPLHDFFEWNNDVASDSWRMHQARLLINYVIEPECDDNNDKIYTYELIDHEYKNIQEILKEDGWRSQILKQAMGYMNYWRNKYSKYNFKELSGIFSEIDKFEKQHGKKTRKNN